MTRGRVREWAAELLQGRPAGASRLRRNDSQSESQDAPSDQAASQDEATTASPETTAPPQVSRPVQAYTAEQLYSMFHANEIKANQTIGDAIVRVTGTIASIQQSDFSKTPEVDIRAHCFNPDDCEDPDAWNSFRADLTASQVPVAADLKIGQTITLQCDKVSMPIDVSAEDCTIVSASGEPASPN